MRTTQGGLTSLLCAWMDVFLVGKQSGVGMELPIGNGETREGSCESDDGWRRDLLLFIAAFAML